MCELNVWSPAHTAAARTGEDAEASNRELEKAVTAGVRAARQGIQPPVQSTPQPVSCVRIQPTLTANEPAV